METIYRQLQRKLNTLGLGLPETDEGFELNYLEELFTLEEAEFALKMEVGPQTPAQVAESMSISLEEASDSLEAMAKRSILFRLRDEETLTYNLLPVIHGFLEFSIDRLTYGIARNFSKHYMKGMGARFYGSSEPLFRILPVNPDLVDGMECLEIDDYEAILRKQDKIAVTACFCRMSSNMNPKATGCAHNRDYSEHCIVLGDFADFYVSNGNGRYITLGEALSHMRKCETEGNVVEVLNTGNVEVMCSCCPCCCGVIKALTLFGGPATQYLSNYQTNFNQSLCINCGKCSRRCFVSAIKEDDEGKVAVDLDQCIGCGLCVSVCPTKALKLCRKPDSETYIPPKNSAMELYDYVRMLRRKTGEI